MTKNAVEKQLKEHTESMSKEVISKLSAFEKKLTELHS